ncbi:MAG TPA: hypothetical protein DEQ79_09530, partial [Alphaproteobacteria bacterium]|nr:hypothetical protein [Alphaproteobacteria bacterium]
MDIHMTKHILNNEQTSESRESGASLTSVSSGKEAAPPIMLPEGYRPSEDEEFMNPMQLAYFRHKLEEWRLELLAEASDT